MFRCHLRAIDPALRLSGHHEWNAPPVPEAVDRAPPPRTLPGLQAALHLRQGPGLGDEGHSRLPEEYLLFGYGAVVSDGRARGVGVGLPVDGIGLQLDSIGFLSQDPSSHPDRRCCAGLRRCHVQIQCVVCILDVGQEGSEGRTDLHRKQGAACYARCRGVRYGHHVSLLGAQRHVAIGALCGLRVLRVGCVWNHETSLCRAG
mmetsp:Transcript_129028/g.334542  ORF Transcript_129028/g.334542 Transcript_129028/m.334542 type:complete len:203 (-) Transcript_129028:770-1378(-)